MFTRMAPEQKLSLIQFFEKVSEGEPVALFGKTGHGKTTLCKTLAYEALASDYYVVYIDTEGGAKDLEELTKEKVYEKILSYHRVTTNDQLIKVLNKVKSKINEYRKVLLIIDSVSMPALVQWARSRRYDERGVAVLEKINAVSHVKELAESAKADVVPVLVLHPVSEMTVSRELQQVARKLAELQGSEGRRQRISIDQLPEEIILQYQRPTGGKSLHMIKEIWLSKKECSGNLESLENQRLLSDDEVTFLLEKVKKLVERESEHVKELDQVKKALKLSKFRVYAWRSRIYPDVEPLIDFYVIDVLGQPVATYRILTEPRTVTRARLRVV